MNSNKCKIALFILLIIILLIIIFYSVFGSSISFLSIKQIKENRKFNENLITTLKINNIDAVYDSENNIYYYNLDKKYENNKYILKIELNDNLKYRLLDNKINIVEVNYDKVINIIVYNNDYYYETKIQFTNLPIVSIQTEEDITTNDTISTLKYINSNMTNKQTNINTKIHVRGATSKYLEKKSYKINFYNDDYTNEKKVSLSNFYLGDSLILDALYRDSSKVRNVLATNLWNDISNDFTNVDIKSEFVELFINNKYIGLYVLTEPINRTKLNLNKSNEKDTSIIIKSTTNVGYEVKYPNDEDQILSSINKIDSIISDYFDKEIVNTYELIKSTWNLENYIDIILFNCFVSNIDNRLEQNVYYYLNSKNDDLVYIQPWDMEFSFGIIPIDEKIYVLDADIIYCVFFHENAPEINKLLVNRYWELRKNILTKEYFDNLLDNYLTTLSKGSTQRDSNLWYEYDIEEEIETIRKWIYDRLDYFDEYVKGIENEL